MSSSSLQPGRSSGTEKTLTSNSLLKRVSILLTGHLSVMTLQALQFLLLARVLGVEEFGRIAAITALVAVATPLSGFGYGSLMLMRVSRDKSIAPIYYANAVSSILGMGTLLVGLLLLLGPLIFSTNATLWLVLWMASSELIAVRISLVSSQLYQAMDQVRNTGLINTAVSSCRVVAVIPLYSAASPSAETWAMTACILTTSLASVVALFSARHAGGFKGSFNILWKDRVESFHFALGTVVKGIYTDGDKILLGVFHASSVVGAYASAYRLVVIAFLPVRALLDGVASRFFREGAEGTLGPYKLAKRLLGYALPYGIIVGGALYFLAPWVPWVLGESFQSAVPAVQTLCCLPAVQTVHYVFADALTGTGFQKLRTRLQLVALAFFGVLGIALIPEHGWTGAAWTCLLSESLLAVMVFFAAKAKASDQGGRA